MDACRFLRPYLSSTITPARCPSYARFFSVVPNVRVEAANKNKIQESDYQKRISQLEAHDGQDGWYARMMPLKDNARNGKRHEIVSKALRLHKDATDEKELLRVAGMTKRHHECTWAED